MKKALLIVLCIVMALTVFACAKPAEAPAAEQKPAAEAPAKEEKPAEEEPAEAPAEDEKITIGMIPYYSRDDFYKDVETSAKNMAEELGVELLYQDPDGDAAKCMQICEDFISQDVDAIALVAIGQSAMIPMFEKAQAAGIPIVTFDGTVAEEPTDSVTCELVFDFFDCGKQLGELIEDYVTRNGQWNGTDKMKTVMITYPVSATVGVPIMDTARDYLIEKGIIEVVAEQDGQANRNTALGVMENILTAQANDVDLIIGFNYDACMGAVEACDAAGLTDKDVVAFSQLWGEEAFQQMEDGTHIWKGGVAYPPTEYGTQAVQQAYNAATGVAVEHRLSMSPYLLTNENIADFDWEAIVAARG